MIQALYRLDLGARPLMVRFVRRPNARRYILRLQPAGTARVTIPRGGSMAHALQFLEKQRAWLEKQVAASASAAAPWSDGTLVWLRGAPVALRVQLLNEEAVQVSLGGHSFTSPAGGDLRAIVESYLRSMAEPELIQRTGELAVVHGLAVASVTVRAQRSRWGSCSRSKRISLNWRLVQTPEFVRDYIIVHELMHLREMNHSPKFWAQVDAAFPQWREAESWLRKHGRFLR